MSMLLVNCVLQDQIVYKRENVTWKERERKGEGGSDEIGIERTKKNRAR